MSLKWSSRFELKLGKWVFVPTAEMVAEGKIIKASIEAAWKPPSYYYHLRSGGGHVKAMRSHLGHTSFLRVDIKDFFGSINKSRVTRCLKSKVVEYETAREWANKSTVFDPNDKKRYFIPFGFVQSQIIAALCLKESALGGYLGKVSKNKKAAISVYVDDIIVSSCDEGLCDEILEGIKTTAKRSGFTLNAEKQEGPAACITAFNILLANELLEIQPDRLRLFVEMYERAENDDQRSGVLSYIASVNEAQAQMVASSLSP